MKEISIRCAKPEMSVVLECRNTTLSCLGKNGLVVAEFVRLWRKHELSLAAELLGQPYSISGIVSEGQKLGRTLSFPTANVVLGDRRVPVAGVYAVRGGGRPYKWGEQ